MLRRVRSEEQPPPILISTNILTTQERKRSSTPGELSDSAWRHSFCSKNLNDAACEAAPAASRDLQLFDDWPVNSCVV